MPILKLDMILPNGVKIGVLQIVTQLVQMEEEFYLICVMKSTSLICCGVMPLKSVQSINIPILKELILHQQLILRLKMGGAFVWLWTILALD